MKKGSTSAATFAAVSFLALAATDAAAQTAAEPAGDVGDIVVTAQKRSERLIDVPLSITAASGDMLANRGVDSPTQLEKVVPGFTYQQTQFGTPVFAIRGIGFFDAAIGASPAVTVYTDQVPLPFLIMTRGATLDLERVEALKGPQGTLFGQNSTGGALNYIAAKPTSTFQAGAKLDIGRFDTVNAEAYVSGPLARGLNARLSGRYEYQAPYQISQTRPDDRYGRANFYVGRLLVDWEPTETVKLEFNVNGWKDERQIPAPQFVAFAPQAPQNAFNAAPYTVLPTFAPAPADARIADWDANRREPTRSSFYQLAMRGDIELSDAITLSSITGYSDFETYALADIDGTSFQSLYYAVDGKIRSFSQELRLAGTSDKLRWMVGGNYQRDKATENRINYLNSTNNGIGPARYDGVLNISQQNVETISGFASLEYEIAQSLSVQGSIRYSNQNRDFSGCLADTGNGQLSAAFSGLSTSLSGTPTTIASGACVTLNNIPSNSTVAQNKPLPTVNDTLKEDNLAWRGGLTWKPDGDTLIYANVTKGYKSGNYTILPAVFATQLTPVTQESVLAYEIGFKKSFLDRRLQLSSAAFYYDYSDKQLLGAVLVPIFGSLPQLVNIPKSRVYGFEAELTARPLDGLRLTSGVTYVNSRVERDPVNPRNPLGQLVSFVGSQFPNTPEWQAVGDAEYEFRIATSTSAFVGVSGSYRSGSYAQFGELPQFRIEGYGLLDLRAGLTAPDGKWRVQVWGRNVTNKFYITGAQRPIDTIIRYAGMPVTYGVTLSMKY